MKTPHALRSATKSVVSALVGLAIAKGQLKDVRQLVLPFFADEYPQTDYGYLWWRPYVEVPGGRRHGIMATGNAGQKTIPQGCCPARSTF